MAVSIPVTPTASSTTSVTLPTHAVGNLIVLFVANTGSTTIPSVPSASGTTPAWNTIDSGQGSSQALIVVDFKATATNHTSGTWTNANNMVAVVLSGQDPTVPSGLGTQGPIGGFLGQQNAINSTSITAPAITLSRTDGSSVILHFFEGAGTISTWNAAPTGYTKWVNTSQVCLDSKNDTTSDGSVAQTHSSTGQSRNMGYSLEIVAPSTASSDFFPFMVW